MSLIYKYRELKAVKTYFRGARRFGRTTTLVHVPTGRELFAAMGDVSKSKLHIAYLKALCEQNAICE